MPKKLTKEEIKEMHAQEYARFRDIEARYNAMSAQQQASPGGKALKDRMDGFDENILARGAEYAEKRRLEKIDLGERLNRFSGSMVPREMQDELPRSEDYPDMPVDTYPNIHPDEMANVEAQMLPDDQMESGFIDFIVNNSLEQGEIAYLSAMLEQDPRLSEIFDKVIETASEFTGSGPVTGPGPENTDGIPARLSPDEFVFTSKAANQIGPDNLQRVMDDAERAADDRTMGNEGGRLEYAFGGAVKTGLAVNAIDEDIQDALQTESRIGGQQPIDEEINNLMISANRMPSVASKAIR